MNQILEYVASGKWGIFAILIGLVGWIWVLVSLIKNKKPKDPDAITRKVLKAIGQKICDTINSEFKISSKVRHADIFGKYDYLDDVQGYMAYSLRKTKHNAFFIFFPKTIEGREMPYYYSVTFPMSTDREGIVKFIQSTVNELISAYEIGVGDMKNPPKTEEVKNV